MSYFRHHHDGSAASTSVPSRLGDRLPPLPDGPPFDLLDWYPKYQSCQAYFLGYAQHTTAAQTLAAFLNIKLPFQRTPSPGPPLSGGGASSFRSPSMHQHAQATSLTPYVRRLVATGQDSAGVLHGLFGDDWQSGIGPLHEVERRNFLFSAKSDNWNAVKASYDMSPDETVPFLAPLTTATEAEIAAAERSWSAWMAMQDWMMGPRAPPSAGMNDGSAAATVSSPRVKRENMD